MQSSNRVIMMISKIKTKKKNETKKPTKIEMIFFLLLRLVFYTFYHSNAMRGYVTYLFIKTLW
jgi:hypothetical protein